MSESKDGTGLSVHDKAREEIIIQLRTSLNKAEEEMKDPTLTPKELQYWMRVHTNIALVLNTVLRDVQLQEWEKRMRILEKHGLPAQFTNSEP